MVGSNGTCHWVNFKNERLAMFCHFCRMMGHDLRHCASYYPASKNNGEVVCQYGDWMKATGARSSLSTRNTTSNVKEGPHHTHKRRSERKQDMPADEPPYTNQTDVEKEMTQYLEQTWIFRK